MRKFSDQHPTLSLDGLYDSQFEDNIKRDGPNHVNGPSRSLKHLPLACGNRLLDLDLDHFGPGRLDLRRMQREDA